MFKIPLAELKEKLRKGSNLTEEELELKLKKKINELSGLISEEGAAHILANELGVKLANEEGGRLKIKEIYAGMKNVEVVGKIITKFDIREFVKGERKGKVANLVLGDETGTLRAVFWNEQTELIEQAKEGDIILIKSGWVKENAFNQKEIHLNERSKVEINPLNESVGEVRQGLSYERKKIGELTEGMSGIEVLGTIVQVSDPRFFQVCPQCGKRVNEKEEGFECGEHGIITPIDSYVLNVILDDGSGTIRGVFWKNQTNNLLGRGEEELLKFKDNLGLFEELRTELLGEQFRLVGRVALNTMFERLEFNVQMVFKAEPEEEIKRLEEGVK